MLVDHLHFRRRQNATVKRSRSRASERRGPLKMMVGEVGLAAIGSPSPSNLMDDWDRRADCPTMAPASWGRPAIDIDDISPRDKTALRLNRDYQSVSGEALCCALAAERPRADLGGHSGVRRSDAGGAISGHLTPGRS
jgi:hypothetical protein